VDDLHGPANNRYMSEKPYPPPSLWMPFEIVPLIDKFDLVMPFLHALALIDHPFKPRESVSDMLMPKHAKLNKRRVGLKDDFRVAKVVFYGKDYFLNVFLAKIEEQPLGNEQSFLVLRYVIDP
jgi:hypothetical protein